MRSEEVNQTLYEISNAVNSTDDLNELYLKIHQSLNDIIDATNFYIALFDRKENMLYFPYFIDTHSEQTSGFKYSLKNRPVSLTALVIEKGESLVFNKDEILAYCREQQYKPTDPVCEIWVGVPLIINNSVIGIITVQSYTDRKRYSENDVKLLNSVFPKFDLVLKSY